MDSSVAEWLKRKVVYNRPLTGVVPNGHKMTIEEECMEVQ